MNKKHQKLRWACAGILILMLCGMGVCAKEEKQYLVYFSDTAEVALAENADCLTPILPDRGVYLCNEDELDTARSMPGVIGTEENDPVYLAEVPPVLPNDPKLSEQWYLDIIGMKESWYHYADGRGVRVAVIDSGVDSSHPDLKNRVIAEKNCCINSDGTEDDPTDVLDTNGHGTGVASVIAAETDNNIGMAGVSSADIVSLRMYNNKGGTAASVALAIEQAVDTYHCDVINMSLVLYKDNALVKQMIEYALQKNVIVVVASGNYDNSHSNDALRYPAPYDGVISVGSVDREEKYSTFSVANEYVDVVAPGSKIYMAALNKTWSSSRSGTSFASPQVAAAAAILRGIDPTLTAADFETLIAQTAKDTETEGKDEKTGYGILQIKPMVDKVFERVGCFGYTRPWYENHMWKCYGTNYGDQSVSGLSVAAVYSSKKMPILMKMPTTNLTAPAGESVLLSVEAEENAAVRFMLFDGLEGIKPLRTYPTHK